jgi:hypothetical protein
MTDLSSTIRPFYDGWGIYNARIVEVIREMNAAQLAVRPAPDRWPLWATVDHTAGARVFWLCGVLEEPGAESTPFPDPMNELGWEDDLDITSWERRVGLRAGENLGDRGSVSGAVDSGGPE